MSQRNLHLAAYDVASPRRLRSSLHLIKGYATGGQKSAYECFLSHGEKNDLLQSMTQLLDTSEDRFLLIGLDPRSRVYALGLATEPVDPPYFYIG